MDCPGCKTILEKMDLPMDCSEADIFAKRREAQVYWKELEAREQLTIMDAFYHVLTCSRKADANGRAIRKPVVPNVRCKTCEQLYCSLGETFGSAVLLSGTAYTGFYRNYRAFRAMEHLPEHTRAAIQKGYDHLQSCSLFQTPEGNPIPRFMTAGNSFFAQPGGFQGEDYNPDNRVNPIRSFLTFIVTGAAAFLGMFFLSYLLALFSGNRIVDLIPNGFGALLFIGVPTFVAFRAAASKWGTA